MHLVYRRSFPEMWINTPKDALLVKEVVSGQSDPWKQL
jgi:hypothetical protein